jgi:hypothetical protein
MKWQMMISILVIGCFLFRSAPAEELNCNTENMYKEGGGEEHALTLVLINNQISGLTYSNVISKGDEEEGASACEIILKEGSGTSDWNRSGKKITIIDKEVEEKSSVEIELLPNNEYKVNFSEVSKSRCGLGAEFPKIIILKKSSQKCVITK